MCSRLFSRFCVTLRGWVSILLLVFLMVRTKERGSRPVFLTVVSLLLSLMAISEVEATMTATLTPVSTVTVAGGTPNFVTITYARTSGGNVLCSSIDKNDITITGLTIGLITISSVTSCTNANSVTVIYSFTPPGGSWDSADNDTYTVSMVANQVSNPATPASDWVQASTLGTFNVNIPSPTPAYDSIPVVGSPINFASITPSDATQTLIVQETGSAALNITSITLGGANSGKFTVTPTTFSIADGSANQNVTVTCDGSAVGTYTATLTVNHNAAGSPATYNLSCTIKALATPAYTSTPVAGSTINFSSATPSNATQTLIVQETGSAALNITSITLGGADSGKFTVTPTTFSIADGSANQNVTVTCDGSAVGTYTATLTVNHNAAGSPATYNLSCIINSSGGGSSGSNSGNTGSSGTVTPPLDPTMKLYVNSGGLGTGQITPDPKPGITNTDCDTVKGLCTYTLDTASWITLTAKADKESLFDRWSGSSYCRNGDSQISADKKTATTRIFMIYNTSCTANFKLVQYNLNVAPSGDGSGTINFSPNALACGDHCRTYNSGTEVELTAQPAADSTFNGWTGDCQGAKTTTQLKISKNSTCNAIFNKIPTYTLNVTTTGNGTVTTESKPQGTDCGVGCTLYLLSNPAAKVTLTPVPALGSTFSNWTGDSDCAAGEVTMTANKNCVANFNVIPAYALTVIKAGDGTGQINRNPAGTAFCPEPIVPNGECSSYPINAAPPVVTLIAQAAPDSTFIGWKGDCSLDGKVTVAGNKQCTATFMLTANIPNYELTVALRGTGQGTVNWTPKGSDCLTTVSTAPTPPSQGGGGCSTYKMGTNITVMATPNAGSIFKGWSGDCNSEGQVNIDGNKNCVAMFDAIPVYRLTTTPVGDGQVTVSPLGMNCGSNGSQPVICNAYYLTDPLTTVTLIPTASPGSVFTGWTGDDDCQDGQVSLGTNKRCIPNFNSFGLLKFSSATYQTTEETELALITVSRAGGSQGEVSVTYQTVDGTAVAGDDYTATTGLLTWSGGDNEDKTFVIPIVYDALTESAETIQLNLANPTGGALLNDTLSQAEVTIADVLWLPSSLQFSTTAYRVNEAAGKVALLVTRAGNHRGAITINYATTDGTAFANSDYTPQTGTLTWPDGDMTHRVVEIPITKDSADEPEETFTVALSGLQGEAVLGEWQTATVTIVNTPPAGNLQFSEASYTFGEGTSAQIAVNRVGGSVGAVSVNYATHNGTAIFGNDYFAQSGTLAWADGDVTTQYITLPLLTDNLVEGEETLTIELSNPTGYADVGSIATTTIHLVDRMESGTTGAIQFDNVHYDVSESSMSVQLTVTRSGGTNGEITVDYATQDDTAMADQDYVATNGQLHWADGEMGQKYFTLNLLDDTLPESLESLKVTLSNLAEGAKLGANTQTTVTIQDDDATMIQFSAIGYIAAENIPETTVTVVRKGSPFGRVSADYTTTDSTATAGSDYVAQRGTLTWFSNDTTAKKIVIPIITDSTAEGWEEFNLSLSNVTEKGILGDPNWVTVVIDDNRNDCQVVNQVVDCFYYNQGVLENIRITSRGAVRGGELKGTIQSQGQVQEVTLQANAHLYGGSGIAFLSGVAGLPVPQMSVIDDTVVKPYTELSQVIIGRNATVDSLAVLGEGVLFEDNNTIPSIIDLAGVLGRFEPAIPNQMGAVKLTTDVLVNNAVNGILGAINGLYDVKSAGIVITQNPVTGYLEADIGEVHCAVLPAQVRQVLKDQMDRSIPLGMSMDDDNSVTFITHTGREVMTYSVVQDFAALQEQLQQRGLGEVIVESNGHLKIPLTAESFFNAQPSLCAEAVSDQTPLGLTGTMPVSIVFIDAQGQRRQQFFYPAVVDTASVE